MILDTHDFKKLVPEIHKHFVWEDELKPKIDQIIMEHIVPFVSEEEFNQLKEDWESEAVLGDERAKVISLLRYAIAHYTALEMYTTERVDLSSAGVTEGRTSDDGTMAPASYHAIADVKNVFSNKADYYLDAALGIMEKHLALFSDWAASDEFESLMSCLVFNSTQMGRYTLLPKSMRVLWMLRADLLDVQEVYLRPELGDSFVDALLEHQASDSLSDEEKAALIHIRRYMSRFALLRALPKFTIEVDRGGVWMRTFMDGPKQRMAANSENLKRYMLQLEADVKGLKARMIEYLEEHADSFTEYSAAASSSEAWRPGRNSFTNKSYRT